MEGRQLTECGLCCICMLMNYYGNGANLVELRKKFDIGRDGSTMLQISNFLRNNGFDTHAYRIEANELYKFNIPVIIFWENKHFVILEKVKRGIYYIVDPQLGYRHLEEKEVIESYSGLVLDAYPNSEFKLRKKHFSISKFLIPMLLTNKKIYGKIFVSSILTYVFTLVTPIFLQYIIDGVHVEDHLFKISNVYFFLCLLALLYLAINWFNQKFVVELKMHLDKTLNYESFKKILELPYKYYELRNKGEIIYNLNMISSIREIFSNQLIKGIIDIGAVIFILIIMFSQSVLLGAIALTLFIVNLFILFITYATFLENGKAMLNEQGKMQGIQIESVYAVLGIKMLGMEDIIFSHWIKGFQKYIMKFKQKEYFSAYINTALSFLIYISPVTILIVGLTLIKNDLITLGTLVAFYSLSTTFFSLTNSVFSTWTALINSKPFFERLSDILLNESEFINADGVKKTLQGNIVVKNLWFKYSDSADYILKDVSLNIKAGEKIALVGKSGEGKSTLAKLLSGLYIHEKGEIYFDDIELREWNLKSLRKQLGIVPQDVLLFNKSIYDNITCGNKTISKIDVENACEIAQISKDIEQMPMKYETIISEMGGNLSGGQKQRIMLARAIVNDPHILILDEATSSLDNINEKKISDIFQKLRCTQIIIAHRLSTVIDADKIYVLSNGRIVEEGTHSQLMEKKGQYFELYNSQAKKR